MTDSWHVTVTVTPGPAVMVAWALLTRDSSLPERRARACRTVAVMAAPAARLRALRPGVAAAAAAAAPPPRPVTGSPGVTVTVAQSAGAGIRALIPVIRRRVGQLDSESEAHAAPCQATRDRGRWHWPQHNLARLRLTAAAQGGL